MPDLNDHDVLIELRTDMKTVKQDLKEIKENTAARLSALEQDHVSIKEFHELQNSHQKLENKLSYWAGGFAVVLIVIELLAKFYH